jgi:hypothetical protein
MVTRSIDGCFRSYNFHMQVIVSHDERAYLGTNRSYAYTYPDTHRRFLSVAANVAADPACQRIDLDPVPCLVRDDHGDVDAQTVSLVENVQRTEMYPLRKAQALNFEA